MVQNGITSERKLDRPFTCQTHCRLMKYAGTDAVTAAKVFPPPPLQAHQLMAMNSSNWWFTTLINDTTR